MSAQAFAKSPQPAGPPAGGQAAHPGLAETAALTTRLEPAGPLPPKAKADAVHLAFATVYKINYLITWNFKHLANAVIQSRLQPVAEQRGYRLPIICTPLQLMGTSWTV